MRRRKRSGRLTALALVLGTLVACGAPDPSKAAAVAVWKPVAVADEAAEWGGGVHRFPLKPGQSLLFWFGESRSPEWTMRAVPYPLKLYPLAADGTAKGSPVLLKPCKFGTVCKPVKLDVSAWGWIEQRPKTRR